MLFKSATTGLDMLTVVRVELASYRTVTLIIRTLLHKDRTTCPNFHILSAKVHFSTHSQQSPFEQNEIYSSQFKGFKGVQKYVTSPFSK